jgi:GNAT superfamily N-acetyltransferase
VFTPLPPGWERFENERYVLNLGAFAGLTFVQRLRLVEDEVEDAYEEIRGLVAARDHYNTTWWVDDRATPPDLTERLLALGLRFGEEPRLEPHGTGMALLSEPPAVEGIAARVAETIEEWNLAADIGNDVFGIRKQDREVQRKTASARFEAQRRKGDGTRFLAWIDGRPAASATVVWSRLGGLCLGGATYEWARGRGAYRALVRARWDAAVARGTPALVVNAGRMSRPILERLGFVAVAELDVLIGEDFR